MTRSCSGCTLCCKLIPVEEIGKKAGVRCEHQRTGKGCAIYAARPFSCRVWRCMWLQDQANTAALSRPDRSHYVIDSAPDTITIREDAGPALEMVVMQIWVDPRHRDAHRDPELRRMLDDNGIVALIRYGAEDGFTLFPPSRSADRQWHEGVEGERVDHNRRSLVERMLDADLYDRREQ
jgi:hypothetical protein